MGATVTTGKRAAAFASGNGTIIYVLFEKTYEKNCYPHTPHWSCVALGEHADIMKWIFLSGSVCEGGMLQNTHGYIKPENYIESWRRELAKPVRIDNVSVSLEIGADIYATIPENKLEQVRLACIRAGQENVFDAIKNGGARLALHDGIDTLLALYGRKAGFLQPWLILEYRDTLTLEEPGLAPPSSSEDIAPLDASIYRIDQDNRLVRLGMHSWHCGGWAYSVVGNFVNEVAYICEMQKTGSAKRLIAEFRTICEEAKPVPPDTLITITCDVQGVEEWHLRSADELARMLGFTAQTSIFTCTFAEVVAANASRELTGLHHRQVIWDVPNVDADSFITPASVVKESQPSLF